MLTTEQKILCAVSHLGVFLGLFIIAPLIVMVVSEDEFVKEQAKQAIAFQTGMAVLGIIGGITLIFIVGIFILLAVAIMSIVFPIIATIRNMDGASYSYPITGNLLKNNRI